MTDDILTKKEAARYLKISVPTLDRLMRKREIQFSKTNGKVLFLKEDLINWVKSKRVK